MFISLERTERLSDLSSEVRRGETASRILNAADTNEVQSLGKKWLTHWYHLFVLLVLDYLSKSSMK